MLLTLCRATKLWSTVVITHRTFPKLRPPQWPSKELTVDRSVIQLNTEHYYTAYRTSFHPSKYKRTWHCECNASRRASYICMSSKKLKKTLLLNTASIPLEPIGVYYGNNQGTRQETYEKLINFRTIRRNATKLNL